MTRKLNLTITDKNINWAKNYAEKENTSVSKLVDELLTKLQDEKEPKKKKSFVERAAGIIKDISIPDIDKARDEYLKEKYGL